MGVHVIISIGLILVGALVVDAIFGDPKWFYNRVPHPVAIMSTILMFGEKHLNKPNRSSSARRLSGAHVILFAVSLMLLLGIGIEHVLQNYDWGYLALIIITSFFLASRSLYDHVHNVAVALAEENGLSKARQAVGYIIGRNTGDLDEPAISRAAIESLAENFSDGITAPVMWFLIGGLPGILVYKMVNTADSMIGHKSERYIDFGWAAARLDDVLNFIPARLTVMLFATASIIWGRMIPALSVAWRDAPKHASPNAGWPEAAMAGALDIKLGGPRQYPGNVTLDGVWLGDGVEASGSHITQGLKLALISWGIMLVGLIALATLGLR